MADSLLPSLKQMRMVMHNITEAINQTLDFPGISYSALQTRLRTKGLQSDMSLALRFNIKVTPYRRLQPEHNQFVTGFAGLVYNVYEQLSKLDAAADSVERQGRFWLIWELFTDTCHAWVKWTELENENSWGRLTAQAPSLSTALSCLMAWLLSTSRNNTYAWVVLNEHQDKDSLISQLYLILFVPVNSFFNTYASSPALATEIAKISEGMREHISLLCCLVYEQLGEKRTTTASRSSAIDRPGRVRHRGLVGQLATAFSMAITMVDPSQALIDCLSTPAVIAFLQLEITLQGETIPSQLQAGSFNLLIALTRLMENHMDLLRSGQGSSSIFNSGSSSLDLSLQSPVSQRRLLRVLCGRIVPLDHPCALVYVKTLHVLQDCWEGESKESLAARESFCGSLVTLAHHCSSRTLLWMQSFQTPSQQNCHTSRLKLTARQRAQQKELKGPVQVMFNKTVLVMVRSIMGAVSDACLLAMAADGLHVDPMQVALPQHASVPRLKISILDQWCRMSGRITVYEALTRDICSPEGATMASVVENIVLHLKLSTALQDVSALRASVSLAATGRKQVYAGLQPTQEQEPVGSEADPLYRIFGLMKKISQAISTSNIDSAAADDIRVEHVSDHASFLHVQPLPLQQLMSVLLTIAVQLCLWRAQQVSKSYYASYMSDDTKFMLEGWKLQCGGLGSAFLELVSELFSKRVLTSPKAHTEVGKLLGRHALTHLHGRLLPGCCHLGCTNVSGPSEAALPTLLCSRCKRARYCSVECQTAAWVKGGHGSLCRPEAVAS